MIAKKKKTSKERTTGRATKNSHHENDKCPKEEKDCSKCKILNCPEED